MHGARRVSASPRPGRRPLSPINLAPPSPLSCSRVPLTDPAASLAPFHQNNRIRLVRDTKVEHAATFVIAREDHTVGNALRGALAADPDVVFSGYRIPHPLEHVMHVRVATSGAKPPRASVSKALDDLADEVADVRAKFLEAGVSAGGVGLGTHLGGGGGGGMGGGMMGGPGGDMGGGGLPPPPGGYGGGGGGGGDPYGYGGGY